MPKLIHALAACLALGASTSAYASDAAQAPSALRVISEGRGALHRADPTVQFVVHSERVDQDFLVQVTPPGSRPWLPGQKAAAAYILDGGYGIAAPAAFYTGGTGMMLPAYIITIAYAPGVRASRERDMLFANATRPDGSAAAGGGGEAFMAFLLDELRPFIEAKYPVDPTRSVLAGHSLAGMFTAGVLARRPEAFAGYLVGSPSVWADPGLVERLARTPVAGAKRRVFVSYGGMEAPHMMRGGRRLARAVARNPAFTSREQVFPEADHRSVYPDLVARGLSYLLPQTRPIRFTDPVRPSVELLRRYVGTYVLGDGRPVEVSLKEDRLTTTLAAPVELLATPSPGRFVVEGFNASLSFEGSKGEAPTLLRIALNGDEAVARRVP